MEVDSRHSRSLYPGPAIALWGVVFVPRGVSLDEYANTLPAGLWPESKPGHDPLVGEWMTAAFS